MKQQIQISVIYTIENYDLFLLLSEFLQNLLSKHTYNQLRLDARLTWVHIADRMVFIDTTLIFATENTIYTYYNDSKDHSIKIVSNRELIRLGDAVLKFLKDEKVTTEVKIETITNASWKKLIGPTTNIEVRERERLPDF